MTGRILKYINPSDLQSRLDKGDTLDYKEQQILKEYGQVKGPIPPLNHLKGGRLYWMIRRDFDGRREGFPQVYAWQASAKAWCLPNRQATGSDLDLTDYEILGEAELPDPENYYIRTNRLS